MKTKQDNLYIGETLHKIFLKANDIKNTFKNIDFIIEGANKTRITSIKVKINEK